MSDTDPNDTDGGGELRAAEYVLGVLPAAEREDFAREIENDFATARAVDAWADRLSAFNEDYAPVTPPASVKRAIDERLFAATAHSHPARASAWSSLAFWRGLTVAAVAALVVAIAIPALRPPAPSAPGYVAALSGADSDVRFVALYDRGGEALRLTRLSGTPAANRDFELWLVEGDNPPASLGVIPRGETLSVALPEALASKLAAGAALAISDEPSGGSTTGAPTGPVLAVGQIRQI